jgi:hypothetical protein
MLKGIIAFTFSYFNAKQEYIPNKTTHCCGSYYLVQGEGFEPPKAEPTDLQSAVFDRFTIPARTAGS